MARRWRFTWLARRAEDALREIGVLLVALAPLDATVTATTASRHSLLFLFLLGMLLFGVAVLLEWSRHNRE